MKLFSAADRERELAFEAFAADSATRLLRAAYLLCGDHQIAEDLLQTTMLRTARRWNAARAAPEAYARAVLINLSRDRARAARRRVGEVLGAGHEHHRAATADTGPDFADHLIGRTALLAALAELPQRQREVIVLRFFADLSVRETAAAIDAAEGTVMSYTARALDRLRALLGERIEIPDTAVTAEVPHDR